MPSDSYVRSGRLLETLFGCTAIFLLTSSLGANIFLKDSILLLADGRAETTVLYTD